MATGRPIRVIPEIQMIQRIKAQVPPIRQIQTAIRWKIPTGVETEVLTAMTTRIQAMKTKKHYLLVAMLLGVCSAVAQDTPPAAAPITAGTPAGTKEAPVVLGSSTNGL